MSISYNTLIVNRNSKWTAKIDQSAAISLQVVLTALVTVIEEYLGFCAKISVHCFTKAHKGERERDIIVASAINFDSSNLIGLSDRKPTFRFVCLRIRTITSPWLANRVKISSFYALELRG